MTSSLAIDTAAILRHHEDAAAELDAAEKINELRVELDNAVKLCSSIKAENASLKQALSDANAFSAGNLQRHAEWKEAWKKERDHASKREQDLQKLKAKLEAQKKELDARERKAPRSDLIDEGRGGVCAIDRLNDIQAEHAQKAEALEQEASKWREQSYESRRNYQELLARNAEMKSQTERQKDIAESLQTEILSLQSAFAEYVEKSESGKTNIGSQKERVCELELQLEGLIRYVVAFKYHGLPVSLPVFFFNHMTYTFTSDSEMRDVRKERDDAILLKDELTVLRQAENAVRCRLHRFHSCMV